MASVSLLSSASPNASVSSTRSNVSSSSVSVLSGGGLYLPGQRHRASSVGCGLFLPGGRGLYLPGSRGKGISVAGQNLSQKAALRNVSGVARGLESLQAIQRADMETQRLNAEVLPNMTENPLMASVRGKGVRVAKR